MEEFRFWIMLIVTIPLIAVFLAMLILEMSPKWKKICGWILAVLGIYLFGVLVSQKFPVGVASIGLICFSIFLIALVLPEVRDTPRKTEKRRKQIKDKQGRKPT